MKGHWTKWCKSHYRHSFCLLKAKELRAKGNKVRIGYTIKEYDPRVNRIEKYSKIYIYNESV